MSPPPGIPGCSSGSDVFLIQAAGTSQGQRPRRAPCPRAPPNGVTPTNPDDVHGDVDVPAQLAAAQILPKTKPGYRRARLL